MTPRLRAFVQRYRELILTALAFTGFLTFVVGFVCGDPIATVGGVFGALAACQRIDRERPDTGPPPSDWGWP